MRKPLGILALVLGIGGLGLWARAYDAHEIENRISSAAAGVVAPAIHGISSTVSGRDISAKGLADTEAEKAGILAALDAVPGRRVVIDEITVLPKASPYQMSFTKAEGGEALSVAGSVPTEAFRATLTALPGVTDAAPLVLASGAPEGWDRLVTAAAAALQPLDFGTAELVDDRLKVTGQARTPVEAQAVREALAPLPADKTEVDLTLLDDGAPAAWNFDYDAALGAKVSGKLPVGLDLAAISEAVGISAIVNEAKQALMGEGGDASVLRSMMRWLPAVETMQARISPGRAEVDVTVGPGTDKELLNDAIFADLAKAARGAEIRVMVSDAPMAGEEGAQRVNVATGLTEVWRGGYWLPSSDITPSLATCTTAANEILSASTINFVSGSDQLDADARAVINRLASVILPCTGAGGLRAQIGGHTDSTGDGVMNIGLSQRRAVAVRKALIERGVPATSLRAQGYGASLPIASNDTEEGKAANRRTTIEWSE